jgi:hypothetical protein
MSFDAETISTPGYRCFESTQAGEGSQWVSEPNRYPQKAVGTATATTTVPDARRRPQACSPTGRRRGDQGRPSPALYRRGLTRDPPPHAKRRPPSGGVREETRATSFRRDRVNQPGVAFALRSGPKLRAFADNSSPGHARRDSAIEAISNPP